VPGRGQADVRSGHGRRDVLDRDAAVEDDPVRNAQVGGLGRECRPTVAAAVDVEHDIEVGPRRHDLRDRRDRDIELVGRGQRPRVDKPQPAVLTERTPWMGADVEPPERRAVDHDRGLGRRNPEPHESVAHRRVDRDRRARQRDRQPLLQQQQAVDEAVRGPGESTPEELRHRLVEVEQHWHADQAQR
jgi:hypothetical protein